MFRLGLMAVALVVSGQVMGRVQGVASLIAGIVGAIGGVVGVIFLFSELILMVGLFLAFPFGTIAYLATWGFFPYQAAAILVGLITFLKVAMVIMLSLAQPRLLKVKALVALVLTGLLLTVVIGFVHAWIPNPVTSIGDQITAIIVLIAGIVWAAMMTIGSVQAVARALRVDRVVS